MIVREYDGRMPQAHPTARAAENAALIGDVRLGESVTIWYGAVLRGDIAPIVIGDGTDIQDGCTVHVGHDRPAVVGRHVVVGHNAVVHGCTVGDGCLIGMGAILLTGCTIGRESIVGAGAVVTEGAVIPPRSVVLGVPARVVRAVTDDEAAAIRRDAPQNPAQWGRQLLPIAAP